MAQTFLADYLDWYSLIPKLIQSTTSVYNLETMDNSPIPLPNDENDVSQHLLRGQQITQDLLAKDEVLNILLEMSDSSSNHGFASYKQQGPCGKWHQDTYWDLASIC
ncbi:hypothetical protein PCASD_01177 [Puccinia coronata f. sp. avenae]|uniref:Uncharacterized protein n=1 Tax=Puccinia coronata f. sp. avenae TaxID=200324 RepID=A0A2N5VLL0_9BASI|nr:hypothetical protein PCASD_01177 [Puccinia coronata f. sp. avenae]